MTNSFLYFKITDVSQRRAFAQIAQLVEQRTENPRVAGSIPALGIYLCIQVHIRAYDIMSASESEHKVLMTSGEIIE